MTFGHIPNLHLLLEGDKQKAGLYVPFGEELVRKLMRSGLYACSKHLVLDDGTQIDAKVVGEQRFLRIVGFACGPFLMESGIIGLQNIGFAVAHLNDGLMHYSTPIRAYAAGKKLLGRLNKLPGIASTPTIELHPTPAMSAEVDEEGERKPESEGRLVLKKFCASRVPPSVFTGKLRLYFQAHYGKELAVWDFRANVANHPPSLDRDARLGNDVFTFQYHSAHTGIFTDSAKRHWLVQLGVKGATSTPNQANVFLMRASKCAEAMRHLLLDQDVSAEDKERIETYILAASYPDPGFCVSKSVNIPLNLSFGYGWHFNWSGTAADIVSVAIVYLGGVEYKYSSTHYRIAITRHDEYVDDPTNTELENEERRWAFELQQVEQKDWKNSKWQEVIASPDWSNDQLMIFGNLWGDRYGDGAPLYCFYTRDTLNVVRYSRSGGGSTVYYNRISDPALAYGETGWATCVPTPVIPTARGLDGVTFGSMTRTGEPVATSFSVGDTFVGGSCEAYSGGITEYSAKTRNYNDHFYSPVYVSVPTNASVGYATESIVTTGAGECAVQHWDRSLSGHSTTPIGPGNLSASWYIGANCSITTYTRSYVSNVDLLCVIPFGDAEAVYLWGAKNETTTDSGTVQSVQQSLQNLISVQRVDGVEAAIAYNYYDVVDAGGHTVISSDSYSRTAETTDSLGAFFVSGNGVQTFVPETSVSHFFAGDPITHVPQNFWTRTSAGVCRDADGFGAVLTGGYDSVLNGKPYVFSGWA